MFRTEIRGRGCRRERMKGGEAKERKMKGKYVKGEKGKEGKEVEFKGRIIVRKKSVREKGGNDWEEREASKERRRGDGKENTVRKVKCGENKQEEGGTKREGVRVRRSEEREGRKVRNKIEKEEREERRNTLK